ncbi:MAG: PTS sugar transporter subunit IIB [Bacilli bacterium]
MIKLLRVDDKLLHGQVAFSWVRNLKIHTILIADDRVAFDEFSKMILGLSKPSGVNLKIMEIDCAIKELNEHANDEFNIMVIVNNIQNAYRIINNIPQLHSLNLGVLREHFESVSYSQHVALNSEEIKLCREMIKNGIEIEMRLTFDDKKLEICELIK